MVESMADQCDVLIVGGGPAGSTCASQLVKSGLDVLVMDRSIFPRDKVCAGWVTPQIFESLDLDPNEYGRNHVLQPISGFRTGMINGRSQKTKYDKTVSYALRRCEFDHYLLQRSLARILQGEPLRSITRVDGGWLVNERVRAKMLVGAGGHFCPVAQWLNGTNHDEGAIILAQEVEFALTSEQQQQCLVEPEVPELYFSHDFQGYGWCVRKGKFLNIGLGHENNSRLTERIKHFVTFLRTTGRINFDIPMKFRGHAYRLQSNVRPRLLDNGVLLTGDAAGLADSTSGEGIRPAVESGLLAAKAILDSYPDCQCLRLSRYLDDLKGRFDLTPVHRSSPGLLHRWASRVLLNNSWFARHILLERWFLHANEPALKISSGLLHEQAMEPVMR